MKILIRMLLLFPGISASGQELAEEVWVRNEIEAFFWAFPHQDSAALRNLAHPRLSLQSISTSADGTLNLTESWDTFLRSIVSISETTKFEEKLH